MRDRFRRDRLIVKLFYTACFVWTGFLLLPLAMITGEPDRWGPSVTGAIYLGTITGFALLPIWVPQVRRQYTGLPRDALEVIRAVWAFLAPFAATLLLWFTLFAPVTLLYDPDHPGLAAGASALAVLVGTALIILLTWDVATATTPAAEDSAPARPH